MYYFLRVASYLLQLFSFIAFLVFFAYAVGNEYFPNSMWFKKLATFNIRPLLTLFVSVVCFVFSLVFGVMSTNIIVAEVLKTGNYQQICGTFHTFLDGKTIGGKTSKKAKAVIILDKHTTKTFGINADTRDDFYSLKQHDKVCVDSFVRRSGGLLLEKYDHPLKVHKQ